MRPFQGLLANLYYSLVHWVLIPIQRLTNPFFIQNIMLLNSYIMFFRSYKAEFANRILASKDEKYVPL